MSIQKPITHTILAESESPPPTQEKRSSVAQLAEKTKIDRENLYKILSKRGNPELRSLDALSHALRFRLAITSSR
jgi:DNA-binding phage protein